MGDSWFKRTLMQYFGMALALVLMVSIFGYWSPKFLSAATMSVVANAIPALTVVTVGMTLVLILGGIDLSVGSVLALSSSIFAVLMLDYGIPLPLAALIAVFCAGGCGLINGWISVQFRIPAFIVTLGMLEIARGGAYLVTNSESKYIGSRIEWISAPISDWCASPAFWFSLICVIVGQWMLHRTVLGRMAVAIGTNAETVRMSGIRAMPYSLSIYCLCGLLCGVGAIMQTSKLETADPNGGIGLELLAIAACVIGGTSLRGGQGSVVSSFIGVIIIQVLQSGLAQNGVSDPMKRVITGLVIIVAVLLDSIRSKSRGAV